MDKTDLADVVRLVKLFAETTGLRCISSVSQSETVISAFSDDHGIHWKLKLVLAESLESTETEWPPPLTEYIPFTLSDAILSAAELASAKVETIVSIYVPDVQDAIALAGEIARSDGDILTVIPREDGADLIAATANGVVIWKVSVDRAKQK